MYVHTKFVEISAMVFLCNFSKSITIASSDLASPWWMEYYILPSCKYIARKRKRFGQTGGLIPEVKQIKLLKIEISSIFYIFQKIFNTTILIT